MNFKNKNKGSALMVTLILGAVMATVSGSYILLTLNSMKLSDRSFNNNSGVSIAEAGLESGLWAYNQNDWTGWSDLSGGTSKKTTLSAFKAQITGAPTGDFDLNRGVKANATIVVYNYASATPKIIVKSVVWSNRDTAGTKVTRWIEADLSKRSFFGSGMIAKGGITFSGNNASVDAYDSRLGPYNSTLPGGGTNKVDKGSVGTVSLTADVTVNNADIWGKASVGSTNPNDVSVGPNGTVGPFGTPAGTKASNAISTDFRAELPDVIAPSTTGSTLVPSGSNIVLTGSNDPANPVVYTTAAIVLNGGSKGISVTGYVTLVCSTVQITGGNTYISVSDTNSGLKMYVSGSLALTGNGIVNTTNDASRVQIFGTATSAMPQDINIKGNGSLAAVVYAPNAAITIGGDGAVYGSIVGSSVRVVGNANFHYDLALGEVTDSQPAKISRWRELFLASEKPIADFN